MPREFRDLSSIERELLFVNWSRGNGVRRFLFDLDDTVCATRPVFKQVNSQVAEYLNLQAPFFSKDQWREEMNVVGNHIFEAKGVGISRWDFLMGVLAEKYSLGKEIVSQSIKMFNQIYYTPLSMLPGAAEGLDFMKKVGMPIGIVTHANRDWTWRKYNWLGLSRYLPWDDVYVVDENGHKTDKEWGSGFAYFRLNPENGAVAGDSPRSDINPTWNIGVRHCFLVESTKPWSVHVQPVNPEVKKVTSLVQIPEVVFS